MSNERNPLIDQMQPVQVMDESARANIETLQSKGELGMMFATLYEVAVEDEPELADIKVWAIGSSTPGFDFLRHTGGAAIHKDESDIGMFEVIINTDDGIGHFQRLLATRRSSAEISAQKVGIEKGKITPEQLASFIFLHELGHIVDFMKNAPSATVYSKRREQDLATLPIAGYDPSKLAQLLESPDGKKWFFKNLRSLHNSFGVSSLNDLMVVQETAYHGMETEDIPDQFAARIMKKLGLI